MKSKVNIQKYYLYFMMYAFIGWFYEQFLQIVIYRWGYSDRGVLIGPYSVIYGFGTLIFLVALHRLIQYKPEGALKKIGKVFLIFLGCMTIATAIELFATYLMEWTVGSWPWQTYSDYAINFQARIALSPSIRFGLGGAAFIYFVQPLFEKLLNKLSESRLNLIFSIVLILFIIDIALTLLVF